MEKIQIDSVVNGDKERFDSDVAKDFRDYIAELTERLDFFSLTVQHLNKVRQDVVDEYYKFLKGDLKDEEKQV